MINHNKKRGFTLIELLVVISIIGLLSSVVLASLNGTRMKGQTASIIEFDTYNYRRFGANLIAKYDFDEANGATILSDSSGSSYSITGSFSMSPNTPFSSGNSLNLKGSTPSATYTLSKPLPVGDLTASIWIYSTASIGRSLYSLLSSTNYPVLSVMCNTNNSLSITYKAAPGEYYVYPNSPACADLNQWHNITISFGTGKAASSILLYIDGKPVTGLTPSSVPLSVNNDLSKITIGGSSPSADTYIDSFKIYSEYLIASEVSKLYAEGKGEHHDVAQK